MSALPGQHHDSSASEQGLVTHALLLVISSLLVVVIATCSGRWSVPSSLSRNPLVLVWI